MRGETRTHFHIFSGYCGVSSRRTNTPWFLSPVSPTLFSGVSRRYHTYKIRIQTYLRDRTPLSGLRPFRRKSTLFMQSALRPDVVQLSSRNTPNVGANQTLEVNRVELKPLLPKKFTTQRLSLGSICVVNFVH